MKRARCAIDSMPEINRKLVKGPGFFHAGPLWRPLIIFPLVACLVTLGLPNHGARATASHDQTVFPADSPPVPMEFPIPTPNSNSFQITGGPDGAFWFCELGGNKIGRVTLSGGFTEFPLAPGSQPYGITSGPDRNLWFTETGTKSIGRITPTGTITEFPLPSPASIPVGITIGPDGNLWFTGGNPSVIGRITPAGSITAFPITGSSPFGLGFTSDGDHAWALFTQPDDDLIGRIIVSSDVTTQYPVPTPNSRPAGITGGPDGNVWFVEYGANRIASMSRFGVFNEYPNPAGVANPFAITAVAGRLFFTEQASNAVGQFDPATLTFGPNIMTSAGPSGIASLPINGTNQILGYVATDANKVGFLPLIVKPPDCHVTLPKTQQSFDAMGDGDEEHFRYSILGGASKCKPTATSSNDWITHLIVSFFPNEFGDGTFVLNYTVLRNTSTQPRSGYIKVEDKFFSVDQAGATPLPHFILAPVEVPTGLPGLLLTANLAGGNSDSTITIEAAGFTSTSIIGWNGEGRPTTLVNSTQLTAQISADDIAKPGTAQVTVFDPSPGGGTSPPVTFTITAAGPDFSLSFDQPTVTAQAGTKARATVNINRTGGFTGNVTVTPPDPAGGIKAKPADPITTTDTSASFKMKIGGGVAPGRYPLVFIGKDDTGRTRTATVTLVVQ